MRKTVLILGLTTALAAPSLASAYTSHCEYRAHQRKVTGTALGAVGGAVLGGVIGHGAGGALLGGAGGAIVGNQLSRTNCPSYRSAYRSRHYYDRHNHYYGYYHDRRYYHR